MLAAAGFNSSLVTPKNDALWPSAKLPVSWSIGTDGWYLACHRALIFSVFFHIKPNSMGGKQCFWSFWVWVACVLRQKAERAAALHWPAATMGWWKQVKKVPPLQYFRPGNPTSTQEKQSHCFSAGVLRIFTNNSTTAWCPVSVSPL